MSFNINVADIISALNGIGASAANITQVIQNIKGSSTAGQLNTLLTEIAASATDPDSVKDLVTKAIEVTGVPAGVVPILQAMKSQQPAEILLGVVEVQTIMKNS